MNEMDSVTLEDTGTLEDKETLDSMDASANDLNAFDPAQWSQHLPVRYDRDWDEACRIAELLGFGADAVHARKRNQRRRSAPRIESKAVLDPEQRGSWQQCQQTVLSQLHQGNWSDLCAQLAQAAQQGHPFDPATFQQLHYIACTLGCQDRAALPEAARHEGGTLIQALYDLCKLVQVVPDEDLEWAFEQGLLDLSPYLVGDRPGEVYLLEAARVAVEPLVTQVLDGLNRQLALADRVGARFLGAELYLQLRRRPLQSVSQEEFLRLSELAGDQAFFHSFLGRQELVHWRHHAGSIRSAFQHLWRAYVQETEYTEEPSIEFSLLGDGILEPVDQPHLVSELADGMEYLHHALQSSLAADRFLRHLWRKFLCRYEQALGGVVTLDCLRVLLQTRKALADEIDASLEFLVANLATRLKQWQYVEEGYVRGLALDPDNLEEMLNLAHFYRGRNRYQEARALYSKALKQRPGDLAVLQHLRSVADRLDLQHQSSRFLTDNPQADPLPPCQLEDLDTDALLAIAAMTHQLSVDQGSHLKAFGEADAAVFPHRCIQFRQVRDLLEAGALLVYRYSPERSYRLRGSLFDFDMDRVEWILNVQSQQYPDLPPAEAAIEILRTRLEADWPGVCILWRKVASHDLLDHLQRRFDEQRWTLNVSDYVLEIVASLLEDLSLRRARWLIDQAVERARRDVVDELATPRQSTQTVLRYLHDCYEKAIFGADTLPEEEVTSGSDSSWSRLFRTQIVSLGRYYFDAAPGEVQPA